MTHADRPLVQLIDDSPDSLALLVELLRGEFRTRVATNGEKGLALIKQSPPDAVLLDVVMPGMDGFEVCERIKAEPSLAGVPVIFLTTRDDEEDERRGFSVGAVDFVRKPVRPQVLLARLRTQTDLKLARDALLDHAENLESEVIRRTRETLAVQDATIMAMATLAETRDHETGNHIRRTQLYVKALATALAPNPRFTAFCHPRNIELLFKSAPLHDIGKVGVPDHILLKPGRLTPEEFEQMKLHTTYGRDAIAAAERLLGTDVSFLQFAREIAYSHQEKWDGSGYPEGLAGDAIPISARIMAVGDVYDALISARVYKPAFSHERAMEILREGRGSHFDPDMVDAFCAIEGEIRAIAARYSDSETA